MPISNQSEESLKLEVRVEQLLSPDVQFARLVAELSEKKRALQARKLELLDQAKQELSVS
jgi:hypothetical protein